MSKEPLKWRPPDNAVELTLASPHFNTCTHKMDNVVIVKETEQVAVFWNPRKNVMHYSIRVHDWYGCKVVSILQFEAWLDNPTAELAFLKSEANFLKSLHQ